MSRREARELVMQQLYQMEINKDFSTDRLEEALDEAQLESTEKDFVRNSLESTVRNLELIDNKIEDLLVGWTMNRISKVDLSILRLAINEIDNDKDIPASVTINEAVDIAKIYSHEESFRFINGLLGTYYRKIKG